MMMVSLITEKLGRQTLHDDESCESLPAGRPNSAVGDGLALKPAVSAFSRDCPTGSCRSAELTPRRRSCVNSGLEVSSDAQESRERRQQQPTSSGSVSLLCSSVCDNVPPKKRHRQCSAPDTVSAVFPSRSHDAACGGDADAKLPEWRPAVRGSSVWRPVAAKTFLSQHRTPISSCVSQQQQRPLPPQLSPGLVRPVWESERSTPSDSPSPRPASASSGFFGSSQGSLNCALIDGVPTAVSGMPYAFQDCLMEVCGAVEGAGSYLHGAATASGGSMPVISKGNGVTPPPSPYSSRHVPPVRCRSQPTVMTRGRRDRSRGTWKKRRRPLVEDERPKLDFLKMKETAYDKTNRTRQRTSYHVQFVDACSTPDSELLGIAPSPSLRQRIDDMSIPDYQSADTTTASVSEGEDASFPCRQSLDSCSDIYDEQLDLTTYSCEADGRFYGCSEEGIEEEGEGEEVFNVDFGTELDIDQIEKH